MTLAKIPHGFGGLIKWVTPVNDGFNLAFFNKLYDQLQIYCVWLGC